MATVAEDMALALPAATVTVQDMGIVMVATCPRTKRRLSPCTQVVFTNPIRLAAHLLAVTQTSGILVLHLAADTEPALVASITVMVTETRSQEYSFGSGFKAA